MESIRIVFFDIDGTLVDMSSGEVSSRTLDALKRLQGNGIKICIATGRPTATLPKFEGVEFDAWLTFNGSYCYDRNGEIFINPLSGEDVGRILDNAKEMGKAVSVATRDRVAANGADDELAQYYAMAHLELTVAPDFDEICRGDVFQLMMGCRSLEYDRILAGTKCAKITAWWDRAADIIPRDGGKGEGVRRILAYYGLDASQAMAFGDGNNDIEMLEAVGTAVAMGNASNQLKAVANAVCGHVKDDGIYHYCVENGLI